MFTMKSIPAVIGILTVAMAASRMPRLFAQAAENASHAESSNSASSALHWRSAAQLHRMFPLSKVRGTLFLGAGGVEFVSDSGEKRKWTALDFETFTIKPHKLVLHTYHDRGLHRPGAEAKEFSLTESVPPAVAAWLAGYFGRPSRNAVPDTASTNNASTTVDHQSVAVHHRAVFGGSNGVLRFRDGGIDYVATSSGESRSWRWEDIQTLSLPSPYRLYVFGYKDTFTFDLKEPLDRALYDHATAAIGAYQEKRLSDSARLESSKM